MTQMEYLVQCWSGVGSTFLTDSIKKLDHILDH